MIFSFLNINFACALFLVLLWFQVRKVCKALEAEIKRIDMEADHVFPKF